MQLTSQQRRTGGIRDHRLRRVLARSFVTNYRLADVVLVAETNEAFGQLSGSATRRIVWHEYHLVGDERYVRLVEISNGHIYKLSARRASQQRPQRLPGDQFSQRCEPRPDGQPVFVRVDTVHSGDGNGEKGAYVIDMVDEVMQIQGLTPIPECVDQPSLFGGRPWRRDRGASRSVGAQPTARQPYLAERLLRGQLSYRRRDPRSGAREADPRAEEPPAPTARRHPRRRRDRSHS